MPPKRVAAPEKKVLLGRPGNTLKMGIVGLPNVGKSSTFNLLSKLNVAAENFPFCTIDPNIAKVSVPDPRFDKLCEIFKPKSQVAAVLNIIDIAGLVPGAHEGAGLGNAFLSHIQSVDGIFHVVRAFESEEITHTEGDVNPIRDLEIISNELIQKDLQQAKKRVDELDTKIKRNNDKDSKEEKEVVLKVIEGLEKGQWVRNGEWKTKEVEYLNTLLFITAKPVVYMVNLSIKDFKVFLFNLFEANFLNRERVISGSLRFKNGSTTMVVVPSFLTLLITNKSLLTAEKTRLKTRNTTLRLNPPV